MGTSETDRRTLPNRNAPRHLGRAAVILLMVAGFSREAIIHGADTPLASQPSTWKTQQFHFIHYAAFGKARPDYGLNPDLILDVRLSDNSKVLLEYTGTDFEFEKNENGDRVLDGFGFAEARRYAVRESPMSDYDGCFIKFPRSSIKDGDIVAAVGRVWRVTFEQARMGPHIQVTFNRIPEKELPEGVAYPGINHALLEGGIAGLRWGKRIELRKIISNPAKDPGARAEHVANVLVVERGDKPTPGPEKMIPVRVGDIIDLPGNLPSYRMRVQAIVPSIPEKRLIGWVALEPLPPLPPPKDLDK